MADKLAGWVGTQNYGKKVLLIVADVLSPTAVEQL